MFTGVIFGPALRTVQRVRRFECGQNTFESRAFLQRIQGFGIGGRFVTHATRRVQQRVLGTDARVV